MKPWWLRLGRLALPQWPSLALVLALTALEAGLEVLKPWPLKWIIDNVLSGNPLPDWLSRLQSRLGASTPGALLAWLVAAAVLLYFASRSIHSLKAYIQVGAGARMTCSLGEVLFGRMQRLTPSWHGRQRSGDLVRRVTTDAACIRDLVVGVHIPLVTSLVSLGAMFFVMWRLDAMLTLFAFLTAPLLVLLMRGFSRPMTERSHEHQQSEGEMLALAEQTLTALPAVQAFGREEVEDVRFRGLTRRTLRTYLRSLSAQLGFKAGVSLVIAAGTALIMGAGGFHVLDGTLTVGSLVVFLSYLSSLYAPIENLAYLTSSLAGAGGKARRVLEVLDSREEVSDVPDARPLPSSPGHPCSIQFEGVSFGYEAGRPVLERVTLDARPGEMLALVGPTGAGKSTLVSLIPRFFDPWEGSVRIDGADVRHTEVRSLRSRVAMLFQEAYLFPVSIAENIAYGRPGATPEEIAAAAEAANAGAFIRRLARGYDTVIGERGATLSGGERQRIAIARAILKDAPILILDEPTSSLDAETEDLLMDALGRLIAGRTAIVIAHRLSTIQKAHRIAVLEEGRVVEVGTHEELLAAGGSYRRLHEHGARPRGKGAHASKEGKS